MDKRNQELADLTDFIEKVEKETTLLLQNLQWDHKHLLESPTMVSCKYEAGHRIPLQSAETHEKQCYLAQQGYSKEDLLLPDAADTNADTVVKFSKEDITNIINTAAASDPLFKRDMWLGEGVGWEGGDGCQPLSAARLQLAYSADERRALHDAVLAAAPTAQPPPDLDTPGGSGGGAAREPAAAAAARSRAAELAELRDMRRRRARYRVRATTTHYSDVLRGLIKTQMELYAEAKGIFIKTEYGPKTYVNLETKIAENENNSTNMVIKQERLSPDTNSHYESSKRYKERSRSRDRKRRTEHENRECDSARRHYNRKEESTERRRFRDDCHNEYSKDKRRHDVPSERDQYYKSEHRKANNGNKREDSTSSKDSVRYEEHNKQSKYYDRNYKDCNKTSKYDSRSKNYEKHKSLDDSKYDRRGKYDDHREYKHSSSRSREDKYTRIHEYRSDKCEGSK